MNVTNMYNLINVLTATTETAEEIVNQVISPMKALITIIVAVLEMVGVFILIKNLPDLINGIQERDSNGISHGALGVGCGVLLMSVGVLLGLFGYSM